MLRSISLLELVKKQTLFKLNALSGAFTVMIVFQVATILFTVFFPTSSYGMTSSEMYSFRIYEVSSNSVIVFTFIWAFIVGILITSKAYRYDDFSFVTSRLSANLANICYLVVMSVFSGFTAFFSSYMIKVGVYFNKSGDVFYESIPSWTIIMSGAVATMLYLLLLGTIGYVIGMLVQVYPAFKFIIPAVFIGGFITVSGGQGSFNWIFVQIFAETSILLVIVKVLLSCTLMLFVTIVITNRLEVRT
ncbi:hypothetical protein AJ85_04660 [Alkalihalobacillus alcalophilus ATCC 27647 = CGMCC 1.3604]|uniref:Uncharacterized protein n=1 Tax=Alkalihalobacillus alcalophilus ATCC 27647 = CGMCC 1.3604 TaxID=1218173 RepID=A0A094WLB4_ALKAL|nr:hypothetical protein [Alkalihalobacillus alcalophilus]KGA97651.1 hypothetical protein BALCAV_0208915 [Alkalihalobacillus alcalophilus ATCC 27647 = CGMCC 1.3604]MED1561314.1 hypothetical protein [Alkalihalobacillus alcalophilus]THG91477.1 hypothetical protein AJ85_04660 [Alkalihalobacillus alcalophilus ATCC 27647 = CGMCC 1.3604]